MKDFIGFKMILFWALLGLVSSCGGEIETEDQPQETQTALPEPKKAAPSQNSLDNNTPADSTLVDKTKTKKTKKVVIIPQVIYPDPDPEPEPWPDPYPGYWEPIDPPMPVEPVPPVYVEPVLIAEVEAVFPGGQSEMMKFINNNIKISDYDLELGCQGKVYVRIVVTKEGKITQPEVLKGVAGCPGLSKSALDVVALMPDWIPAANNGQKVSSYVTFPIVIKYE